MGLWAIGDGLVRGRGGRTRLNAGALLRVAGGEVGEVRPVAAVQPHAVARRVEHRDVARPRRRPKHAAVPVNRDLKRQWGWGVSEL